MRKNILLLILLNSFLKGFGQQTGTFIDSRDGKLYNTVKIGNQIWFAENVTFKADSGCWAYKNDEKNVAILGRLYTWETANIVCPVGWHLPSDDEWITLEKSLGMPDSEISMTGYRGENANVGKKLKSVSGWITNDNATDDYGFKALPGGNYGTIENAFYLIGVNAMFWTSTTVTNEFAWYRDLDHGDSKVYRGYRSKKLAFSVRCIKN